MINILIDFVVLLPINQTGPIPPSRDELPRTRREHSMAITGHDHWLREKPWETGGQGLEMDKAGGLEGRGAAGSGGR